MEAIRTIQDFKDFMNANYNNIYSNARLEGLNITFPQTKTPTHPQRSYRSSRVQMVVIEQWRLEEITQRNA